ncbi:outer membrane protein [Myroides indicus]|uniref:Outer membrane protein n=2 Tax=Myroides indicus TaxID=1323422 RepID=A0A4R7F960_9FLAO|nr:outer membrane protein [Myroides indicus]
MIRFFKIMYFLSICFAFGLSTFAQNKKWSLDECINYAIEHNVQIKQYELEAQSAEINKQQNIGNFFPTINAEANHSWTISDQMNVTSLTTSVADSKTFQASNFGISIGVDIYGGMQNQNKLVKSRLALVAARYQVQKMKEDVALNVVNSYLQVLFNKELIKTNKVQLEFDQNQEVKTQELVNAGVVPAGDLLDVQATVAAANQRLIASQNEWVMAKLNLAQLLQIDDYENFDISDSDYEIKDELISSYTANEIKERAFESLTDIKTAEINVETAEKDVRIAQGAYHPKLRGFYNFGTNIYYQDRIVGQEILSSTSPIGYVEGTNQTVMQQNRMTVFGGPESFFTQFDNNKSSTFGLSLSIPIFNGMQVRNSVKLSKLALEQIQNEKEVAVLKLEQLVFKAYTDTESALKTFEASELTLNARERSLEYARERYAVGLINIFELNQNQNMYVAAQSDFLKSKYDYIFKTKILEYYFGIPLFKNE